MTAAAPPPLTAAALDFARAVRARHGAVLSDLGLHPGQDLLLAELWRGPALRLSALADALAVEPPTVTRMVARLERGGLVERRRDPDDGRATLVAATPRSRLLEAGVRRAWEILEGELAAAPPAGVPEGDPGHQLAGRLAALRSRAR